MSENAPKKISFGLGSGLKPGFSKPRPITSLDHHIPDTRSPNPSASLVIPLKESDKIIRPAQTPVEDLAKFEPKKYGLQLRKKPNSALNSPAPTQMDVDVPSSRGRRVYNEEEQLKDDLERLPDEPDKKMYQSIPVEEFGVALLKGMGWNGSKESLMKQPVSIPKQRPERLGLGAKEGQPMTKRLNYVGAKQSKQTVKEVELKISSQVSVKEGPHSGKTGEIIEILGKGFASIKLNYHPHLIQIQTSKLSISTESQSPNDQAEDVKLDGAWPGAVVRIASKSIGDGKYYHRRAAIIDSHLSEGSLGCTLKVMHDNTLLHDIPITSLTSDIPVSRLPCKVIILAGEHSGQRGILLQLIDDHNGTIQLEDDHSVLLTLPISSFTLSL